MSLGSGESLAIEVSGLEKSFQIPEYRVDSLRESLLGIFRERPHRELHALEDIDFQVAQGEFFGIVGKNGSGKSTLLKILASIYRADAGSVRIAGRLAPFIELGVGLNQQLTARENVVLNGVMVGLSRKEAASRLDAILDFSELEEFVDLPLKNYSSGMLVRLAFSIMIQSDADVLLIDEVLAVGDAAFQRKCAGVLQDLRRSEKTVLLVTHDMSAVDRLCDRGILLHRGKLELSGRPRDISRRYLDLNSERLATEGDHEEHVLMAQVDLDSFLLEGQTSPEETVELELGQPIRFSLDAEPFEDLTDVTIRFVLLDESGIMISSYECHPGDGEPIPAGRRLGLRAEIGNVLAEGRYLLTPSVISRLRPQVIATQMLPPVEFTVGSGVGGPNLVSPPFEVEIELDGGDGR